MNFHLEFSLLPFPEKITYQHHSLFMGSCFAENIAALMKKNKFSLMENPNGILYDPHSITAALRRYMRNEQMKAEDLFFANDTWNSWEHHSRFSDTDQKECLAAINDSISAAHERLKECKWLFITFGSAFVYWRDGKPVANCHKIQQKEFSKKLLEASAITKEYRQLFEELKAFNPGLKIVLTVSPVRYIRDGVVENNLSKSRLLDAVHQLTNDNVIYFPAYELVIDDLRDYRFYKEDLVHPNEQAILYVFEKFKAAAFSEEAIALSDKLGEVLKAMQHKPFQPAAEAHMKFRTACHLRCLELKKQFPFLDLEEELRYFSA
jgi:hypothetical protein